MWARHERYPAVVQNGWHGGLRDLTEVHAALGQLRIDLVQWSRDEFGSVKKQLRALREKLETVRADSIGAGPSREERDLMREISEILSREETMVKQRSRVLWLAEGEISIRRISTRRLEKDQGRIKLSHYVEMMALTSLRSLNLRIWLLTFILAFLHPRNIRIQR